MVITHWSWPACLSHPLQARHVLMGERVALNILARASGIASRSKMMASIGVAKGWRGKVAGTRKTTPGKGTHNW